MATEKMVAFWLMPTGEARVFFRKLIAELAGRCDAPEFEAHVTLAGGDIAEADALAILRRLTGREPLELEIERIDFSAEYTKTLFVQFRSSPEIETLAAEIQRGAGTDYELKPHLSLLYKEMAAAEKEELANEVFVPFRRVSFDRVKVIATPHPITTREQVEAWRTLGEGRPLKAIRAD